MKKILRAFTYIELIVVISIITLLSSTWVFYFNDFVKNQEIEQKVSTIEEDINSLDKSIKNNQIFDYELQFNTSTWSKWYISYINNFDIPYNQNVTFNSITWSWTIWTNWNSSLTWNLKLYKNHKLYISELIQSNNIYNFDFNDEPNYKIIWTLSWEVLNEININYFAEDNLTPEKNNLLVLQEINTKEDKSWTWISSLIVKNIWWTKSIIWDWIYLNEAYLFFENSWKDKFIKIK